jgi:hypothetical protein
MVESDQKHPASKILVRPGGVLAEGGQDVDSLAVELSELTPDVEVSIEPVDRGRSFAFLAVLSVVLPWVEGYLAAKAIDTVLGWARRHIGSEHGQDQDAHPIDVTIYGPNGEVLKKVRVSSPEAVD